VTGTTWEAIASHSAQLVIVAARKQSSSDETIDKIKQETPDANPRSLILDVGNIDSVKQASDQVNKI
jgi:hypothetical protein